jgi:SPP1 gp7 family putative phage head morphogenesis protein
VVEHTSGRAVKRTGQESELYRAAQAFRNGLLKGEETAVGRMRGIYAEATAQLKRELMALETRLAEREAQGKPLADAAMAMRDRLERLIEQTRQRLADVSGEGVRVVSDGQQTALEFVNAGTGELLAASTGDPSRAAGILAGFDRLDDEAIQAFVGFSSDGSPLAVLFDQIATDVPNALQYTLASGIAQGRNPRAVAREMSALASLPRRRAETIARTEMIRAAREGQRLQYGSNPAVTGYRRVAAQDARVCPACLALSGTLHKTAEIMPSHPNCRCVMVPVTPSLAEITGDPSIPDLRPGPVTPEIIMAGLSESELRGILGPARLELLDQGYPLADMVEVRMDPRWGPTTRVKPLKELEVG